MSGQNLITRESMFEPLLQADRSFAPLWRAFLEEWKDEREPPLYLALANAARHLVGQLKAGDTEKFQAVFDVVERWHLEGDTYVRTAASLGLLEDLQNTSLHEGTSPTAFEPWLRPESRRWWNKVDGYWTRGESLADF